MSHKTTEEKLDEILQKVTRLETLWNGGPGSWHVCQQHTAELERGAKKLAGLNKIVLLTMGGASVILWILGYNKH